MDKKTLDLLKNGNIKLNDLPKITDDKKDKELYEIKRHLLAMLDDKDFEEIDTLTVKQVLERKR